MTGVTTGYRTVFKDGDPATNPDPIGYHPSIQLDGEELAYVSTSKFTADEELARGEGGLSQGKSDEELAKMTPSQRRDYHYDRDAERIEAHRKAAKRAEDEAESVKQAIEGKGQIPDGVNVELVHPVAIATKALLNSGGNNKQV